MKKLLSTLLAVALLVTMCTTAVAENVGLRFSDALVSYIEREEGFRSSPYNDGTGWYIGYGNACDPADWPGGITEAAAETLLRETLDVCARDVNAFLSRYGISVSQQQFDALCAMSYNFGSGWLNPANRLPSYLIRGIGNYTDQQIASAFGAWCHVNGQVSQGLLQRRIMELKLFLYGDYSFTYDGWNWLLLNADGGEQDSDVALYRTGAPYGVLPEASYAGMYLAGWRRADGTLLNASDPVTANLRVTAVWSVTPAETPAAVPGDTPSAGLPQYLLPAAPPAEASVTGTAAIRAFRDVPADAWYAGYVEKLSDMGILGGYEDGTFRPSSPVTWGETLKLVLLAAGFQAQLPPEGAHWAAGYRTFAVEKGYIGYAGVPDLNAVVTRDAVADLCAASLELPREENDAASRLGISALLPLMAGGDKLPWAATEGPPPFTDTDSENVAALYEAGILEGSENEDGEILFRGADDISRAELCAILLRMMDYVDEFFVFSSGERSAINFGLRLNPYDPGAFYAAEDGRVYFDAPEQTARCGVDVSYYQGDIDWARVRADGVDFAIIRCGFRGYGSEGTLHEDEMFRRNVEGALAAGLDVGVYFFSQAVTVEEAREEAALTLELIDGYDIRFPVVFDWEQLREKGSRSAAPDWDVIADCTEAFCGAVAEAGYTPMSYFNKHMAYIQLDMERVQAYDGWLAWYHAYMDYIYDFQMWQYSDHGHVDGIAGDVDMNICLVDFANR